MRAANFADPAAPIEALGATMDRDGFLIFPGLLSADQVAGIRGELDPVLQVTPRGRNDFEGFTTKRVYALLAHAPTTALLVENPLLLALVARLLEPNFLLSAHLAIQIFDGESAQSWHFDDGFYRQPLPRPPSGVSAVWCLDAFTQDNGATELIPGSHEWGQTRPPDFEAGAVKVITPAGSLLVFPGNLTHRGGANAGAPPRLAVTTQFCQPWAAAGEHDDGPGRRRQGVLARRSGPDRLFNPSALHGPSGRPASLAPDRRWLCRLKTARRAATVRLG